MKQIHQQIKATNSQASQTTNLAVLKIASIIEKLANMLEASITSAANLVDLSHNNLETRTRSHSTPKSKGFRARSKKSKEARITTNTIIREVTVPPPA